MKILAFTLTIFILFSCATQKAENIPPRSRVFKDWKAYRYHNSMEIKIGWFPYTEKPVLEKNDRVWSVYNEDSLNQENFLPVIMIEYPDSTKNLTLNMEVDEALFGKLIKHSLMTQMPIERPFKEYLQKADCTTCHPAHIKLPKTKYQLDRIREKHKFEE